MIKAIAMKCSQEQFKNKAFWLNDIFNWEIKRDNSNTLCLIPTPKQN